MSAPERLQCVDVEGDCCGSCHSDWEDGYGEPFEVSQSDVDGVSRRNAEDPWLGDTCCAKHDAVVAALLARISTLEPPPKIDPQAPTGEDGKP